MFVPRFETKSPSSERKSIHEYFVHDGRRRHQVLQLQVEDALQALYAERPQLGQLAQQTREGAGLALAGLRRAGATHVLPEASQQPGLELLHALGLLKTVAI